MKKRLLVQITVFLVITAGLSGMFVTTDIYSEVKSGIVDVLCLSCIKLQPKTNYDFTFKTANGKSHPDFVVDALKNKNSVFIEYGYEGCDSCDKMIENVIKPLFDIDFKKDNSGNKISFEKEIIFDNTSFYYIYINIDEDGISEERKNSYNIYDKDHIGGFPQFTIITLEYHHSGDIKPYYTTLYGEFEGEYYDKAKQTFKNVLEESSELYDRNIEGYK